MSSLINKMKDKLNIGSNSSDNTTTQAPSGSEHHAKNVSNQAAGGPGTDQTMTGHTTGGSHHTTGQTTGPMTGNTGGHTTQTSSHHTTGQHTGHGKHPNCNEDHEHTMACGLGMHQHGNQDAWSHAHSKTQEASKHANASELAACKAQEHYSSLNESQKNADDARLRQQELEAEMEKLRGQGVDVTGHHKKLEDHKRHLADLENQHAMAIKAAKEKDHDAAQREREAGKLHDMHARKQQGLTPLEAELENLRREREGAHANHQTLQGEFNDRHNKHKARASEIERHNNELLTHGNKIKELEAELAAAKERANKHHTHLMGLKDEHDAFERDLPNHQKRLDHAHSRIGLLKEKEAELMRQHGAHKDDLEKHHGLMTDAQRDAEAHRAQADKARAAAQGLPGQMDTHKQGMMEAQQAHADAARRQKEIDAQANKLGSHLDKARAHADQMDTTTAKHSDNLEQAKREAEMHAQRKQQAWNEAQEAGKGGSSMEGSHLSSLKDKIKDMAPGHHSSSTTTTSHNTSR